MVFECTANKFAHLDHRQDTLNECPLDRMKDIGLRLELVFECTVTGFSGFSGFSAATFLSRWTGGGCEPGKTLTESLRRFYGRILLAKSKNSMPRPARNDMRTSTTPFKTFYDLSVRKCPTARDVLNARIIPSLGIFGKLFVTDLCM